MNEIERPKAGQPSQFAGYDQDYALWSAEQAALIRAGRLDSVDLENVAEEIESLGRSDKREIESRLKVLAMHLLKSRFQPGQDKSGWRLTIREQRRRILKLIGESPSLASYPERVLAEEYELARLEAAAETGMPLKAFPTACPFTTKQILDPDFFADDA